jgi:acyl-CoA thioesterase
MSRKLAVALVALLIVLAGVGGFALSQLRSGDRLSVVLPDAIGIVEGTPVQLNGFDVGQVTSISARGDKAVLDLVVDRLPQPLRAGTTVTVEWRSLLGERYLQLQPGPERNPVLPDGALISAGSSQVVVEDLSQVAEAGPADQECYLVDRMRDDEFLSTRVVRVGRDRAGEAAALATATVSFQVPRRGTGPSYQAAQPAELPDPHGLPACGAAGPLEVRRLGPGRHRGWVRVTEELPDRILPHTAALVYATDLVPLAPSSEGYVDLETGHRLRPVVLDRTLRVHRGFRADDWVCYEHESVSAADYRAHASVRFYSSMGRLIASVSQETALVPDRSASPSQATPKAALSAAMSA